MVTEVITKLSITDIINIISILMDSSLIIYISYKFQKSINNKRTLKDILILEIKEIRQQHDEFYKSLLKGTQNAKDIKQWLKLMTIKINSISPFLKEYKIDNMCFNPYTVELREIITESDDFQRGYNYKMITFDNDFKKEIFNFHNKNNKVFLEVILKINNH
jgi:hypothetical protein